MRRHNCKCSVWLLGIPGRKTETLRSVYVTQKSLDPSKFFLVFFDGIITIGLLLFKSEQEAARARAETFFSKMKLHYQRSVTENTLISSQLNSPELLKLTGLPARLIVALSEHSSVEQRYRDGGGQIYPGQHSVC